MVENLEDMWKVTKLQQERKARLEEQAAREEMSQLKAAAAPPAQVGMLSANSAEVAKACHMPCLLWQSGCNPPCDCRVAQRRALIAGRQRGRKE